jgi:hypothetical protein
MTFEIEIDREADGRSHVEPRRLAGCRLRVFFIAFPLSA